MVLSCFLNKKRIEDDETSLFYLALYASVAPLRFGMDLENMNSKE